MTEVTKVVRSSLSGAQGKARQRGKIVNGTVEGDVHDIGKVLAVSGARFRCARRRAEKIGAAAYAEDAHDAVAAVNRLLG